jgi:hypothetical protein
MAVPVMTLLAEAVIVTVGNGLGAAIISATIVFDVANSVVKQAPPWLVNLQITISPLLRLPLVNVGLLFPVLTLLTVH